MPGIDFGTTFTKVAILDESGRPVMVPNKRGALSTPSCLYRPALGAPLLGVDACEQGVVDPPGLVHNFKLKLATDTSVLSDGRHMTAVDAAEIMIGAVKQDIERALGATIEQVVATCPANSRDDFKNALQEAYSRNNLRLLALWSEPTAAGLAYAFHKSRTPQIILVYDLGGGTFDVSILRIDGVHMDVLATEGVHHLGGNDFSELLRRPIYQAIRAECGREPNPSQDGLCVLDIEAHIEQAKVSFAFRPEVVIPVAFEGKQLLVPLNREQFEKDSASLVHETLAVLDVAMTNAGVTKQAVDAIVMVGGTSRFPFIQQAVTDHMGRAPRTDVDPEKAVAYGAALAYAIEMERLGKKSTFRGVSIPAPGVFVRDVTAHAVGVAVVDRGTPDQRLTHCALIAKNTPVPCRKVERFFLEHLNQAEAHVEILQGQPDANREDCLLIGQATLAGLPEELSRSARVQVEVTIDRNGMVTAIVTDLVSGQSQTLSVDYRKGLQPTPKPASVA